MRNRLMVIAALAACATTAATYAKPPSRAKVNYTPEQIVEMRAEAHRKMLEQTGGRLMKPGVGKGMVAFFNCQSRIAESNLLHVAASLARPLRIKVAVVRGDGTATPANASDRRISAGAAVGVFVVDDPGSKNTVLVSPEGRWAIVNVAALAEDGAEPAFIVARTKKEMVRAFLFACNGADSQSTGSLMGPVTDVKELDLFLGARPPVDVMSRAVRAMPKYGLERWEQYTYREACEQGWAPTPTNDYQKAIWEKVHAAPKNPMKIEFDPKKGK